MQAGYETRDKYIRYSTRGHNNAANRSAPSSRASCCRGLSAPAMARPLRLCLNCPPARGGPAPIKLKAARLGRLLLAIAAGRMQPRIAHRPYRPRCAATAAAAAALAPAAILGCQLAVLHARDTGGRPCTVSCWAGIRAQDGKQAVNRGAGREIGGEARASSMRIPWEKCPN